MSEVLDDLERSDDPIDREVARVLRAYQEIKASAASRGRSATSRKTFGRSER